MTTYAEVQKRPYVALECLDHECVVKRCVVGGLIGGIAFVLFQMVTTWILGGYLFSPVKMIAAMLLSADAIKPWFSYGSSVTVGLIIHFLFSALFGAVFGNIVAFLPRLASSRGRFIAAAIVFGSFLWLINYNAIALIIGWNWFPEGLNPVLQGFAAHTLFYGAMLGWVASRPQIMSPEVYYD